MAKAKNPKLGLPLLTSFQICRPKKPCSMIKPPLPTSCILSPLNSNIFDISFPATPIPPPSTPSKTAPFASASPPKPCSIIQHHDDEPDWSVSASTSYKRNTKHKLKSWISSPTYSSETDSLLSSPLKSVYEDGSKKHANTRRFKRYGSKEWKEGAEYHERKSILGRVAPMPCTSDRKVSQSFVVVKRSADPYQDFKKSMSEMILEKQIFGPKELEQLLMSFLSLNSRLHHRVIIEAFAEILKEVFCG